MKKSEWIRLIIIAILIAYVAVLAAIYFNNKMNSSDLTMTEVALMDDGTKITYYIDNKNNEYYQLADGEIMEVEND